MILFFTFFASNSIPLIDQIMIQAPSLQIPTHSFLDNLFSSQHLPKVTKISGPVVLSFSSIQQKATQLSFFLERQQLSFERQQLERQQQLAP